jgi:hypothetical protein
MVEAFGGWACGEAAGPASAIDPGQMENTERRVRKASARDAADDRRTSLFAQWPADKDIWRGGVTL